MRATVEPLEGNRVKLSVEVDQTELEPAIEDAFKRLAREVRIPGFRPGKVPRRVLEARVGGEYARREAIQHALPAYYLQALRENDVDAIAKPKLEITGGEADGDVSFEATVEVRPTITIDGYGGLSVTVPSPVVTDEHVDEAIDRLRSGEATFLDVDRPAATGDVVTLDLKAVRTHEDHEHTLDDVTDYTYQVGEGRFPDEVEQQLVGASAGDDFEVDADPGDGAEHPIHFAGTVKLVQEKVLPELTDEWVDEHTEFDTVDELRGDFRARLGGVRRVQCMMAVQEGAMTALADLVEDPPPAALVDSEVDQQLRRLESRLQRQGASIDQYLQATGQSGPDLVEQLRTEAAPSVKADLALRALADAEGFDADDDEIDREIARLAAEIDQDASVVRTALEREDGLRAVRSGVRKAKAIEWLMEHVEVTDGDGNPVDRAMFEPPRAEADKEAE